MLIAVWLSQGCLETCCEELAWREAMTYEYYQDSGRFTGGSGEWRVETWGYSGNGKGLNNPDYQCVPNTGPAPATTYKIVLCKNWMHTHATNRPCSFYLYPVKEDEMCGRSEIFIHGCDVCTAGDSTQPPAPGCSAGCVIISVENRQKLRVGDTVVVHNYDP